MTARKVEIDFEKLSVNNSEECRHWITLLDTVVRYHRDVADAMKETEMAEEEVAQIHEAWANGVADAATFIEMINAEEEKGKKKFVVGVD